MFNLATALQTYYFSSEIPTLVMKTDEKALQIKFYDDQDNVLFESTFYAYKGTIEVTALREIIEEHMRSNDLQLFNVAFYIYDTTGNYVDDYGFWVIFCDRKLPMAPMDFVRNSFLTLRKSAIVPREYTYSLQCLLEPRESPDVYYYPVIRDSATGKTKAGKYGYGRLGQTSTSCKVLTVGITPRALAGSNNCAIEDVLSCTIKVGNRAFTIFYEDAAFMRCLSFKNCFNVWEDVFLRGVTTRKTEVDRQQAVCNGIVQFYDQRDKFTYEFQSTGLPVGELRALEQLITSREVKLNESPILITEHECEFHDDNAALNTIKFTFRYADDRQHIEQDELPADGVFNDKYNHTFS